MVLLGLAEILTQHPEICVSDPKEPNIVASHKGTFGRDDSEPDWVEYAIASMEMVCGLIVRFMQWLAYCSFACGNNWPDAHLSFVFESLLVEPFLIGT